VKTIIEKITGMELLEGNENEEVRKGHRGST
jgi:hypothetical protein